MFLRGVFIFCHVTENEPKEDVQKPTVSKDFPYAQNAPWERRFERSRVKAHHTLEIYPTASLIASRRDALGLAPPDLEGGKV